MNVAPAPVMLAAILSPASAGAFAPGALASPVCAWLPDGWHAATNSSVDSASAVVRKMDVFMWAPWGGASRLLGSAHGMMFLLPLDDSADRKSVVEGKRVSVRVILGGRRRL